MAVKIVSDLHSAVDALKREISPDDTLLLLGDLINIIDYTMMDGILVDIFGAEVVGEAVSLRAARKFDEARAVMARRREGREAEIAEKFQTLFRDAYTEVRDALPKTTYVIFGNVDNPSMTGLIEREGVIFADGMVVELQGLRVGFISGALPTPLRVAGEIPEEEFDAKFDRLGDVDILCAHIPPDLPELTYDILARRHERGSARMLEYISDVQPQRVFFGHIHQPVISSTHVGKSHLMNAGYFRKTERAVTLKF